MLESSWHELCAYASSVWGRELTMAQKAAGWKLLAGFPDQAIETAITTIAESGREQLPPWPLVYQTAEGITNSIRELNPRRLPAGDSLSDAEHKAAMIGLRAKQTPEQRRRADAVTMAAKGLPMTVRLRIAKDLLTGANSRLSPELWNASLDEILSRESKPNWIGAAERQRSE